MLVADRVIAYLRQAVHDRRESSPRKDVQRAWRRAGAGGIARAHPSGAGIPADDQADQRIAGAVRVLAAALRGHRAERTAELVGSAALDLRQLRVLSRR